MSRSSFSSSGLNIGENTTNMTYLYGISDFFSVMFENTDTVNLLLESSSEVASETYSKFLQMTSTISLEDIQTTLGQSLKLVTIKSTDKVAGEINLFKLPINVVSSRYIANRPLLPTALFEQGVEYRIEKSDTGEPLVRFAKDISNAGFSTRTLSDGTTREYALWFVDTEIDENWISNHFGNLIGLDPQESTEAFKNFVTGLYYIYANGPTVDLIRKGLNLCLGVPLARGTEQVIDIRKYLETDQYIVVTDSNQYLIPFGLDPVVQVGDVVHVSDELAKWVEVKDYIKDGDWWINLAIPPNIIPTIPEGQSGRYATEGSHFDYLMRNYLKKHTFLINVKVKDVQANKAFSNLSTVFTRAKPTYTYAIYVWSVPNLSDEFSMDVEELAARRDQWRCENLILPIDKFYRSNETTPLKRGCPTFIRYNVPAYVENICGTNPLINGLPIEFENTVVYGYLNPMKQYRSNIMMERTWIRTILERNSEVNRNGRSSLGFYRGTLSEPGLPESSLTINSTVVNGQALENTGDPSIEIYDLGNSGLPVHWSYDKELVPKHMKVIPLYITTQTDIVNKCTTLGLTSPSLNEWTFEIPVVERRINPINHKALNEYYDNPPIGETEEGVFNEDNINTVVTSGESTFIRDNFLTLFFRGNVPYLSNMIPEVGFQTWAPANADDITLNDYLLGVRIYGEVVGIYWVTENTSIRPKIYFPINEPDILEIAVETAPMRGLGSSLSPYYITRGRGRLNYNNVGGAINGMDAINEDVDSESTLYNPFADTQNISPVTITRSGNAIKHRMEYR